MPPTRQDLELAIAAYWDARDRQAVAARVSGSTAEGNAGAVRGGGTSTLSSICSPGSSRMLAIRCPR